MDDVLLVNMLFLSQVKENAFTKANYNTTIRNQT